MVSVPRHRGQDPEEREAHAEVSVGTPPDAPQTQTPGCGHVLLSRDPALGTHATQGKGPHLTLSPLTSPSASHLRRRRDLTLHNVPTAQPGVTTCPPHHRVDPIFRCTPGHAATPPAACCLCACHPAGHPPWLLPATPGGGEPVSPERRGTAEPSDDRTRPRPREGGGTGRTPFHSPQSESRTPGPHSEPAGPGLRQPHTQTAVAAGASAPTSGRGTTAGDCCARSPVTRGVLLGDKFLAFARGGWPLGQNNNGS